MKSFFSKTRIYQVPESEAAYHLLRQSNHKHCLIVLQKDGNKDEQAFLSKVLNAAQIDMERDILLIEATPESRISFAQLQRKYRIESCLLFGMAPRQMGLLFQLEKYELHNHQGVQFLYADSPASIQDNVSLKSALWSSLKSMFSV